MWRGGGYVCGEEGGTCVERRGYVCGEEGGTCVEIVYQARPRLSQCCKLGGQAFLYAPPPTSCTARGSTCSSSVERERVCATSKMGVGGMGSQDHKDLEQCQRRREMSNSPPSLPSSLPPFLFPFLSPFPLIPSPSLSPPLSLSLSPPLPP